MSGSVWPTGPDAAATAGLATPGPAPIARPSGEAAKHAASGTAGSEAGTEDGPEGMTTPAVTLADWEAVNQQYLAAALRWLRLRLERLVDPPPGIAARATADLAEPMPVAAQHAPEDPSAGVDDPFLAAAIRSSVPPPLDGPFPIAQPPNGQPGRPPASTGGAYPGASGNDALDEAAAAMDAAAAATPTPALVEIGRRLGLSRFDLDVLLLVVAIDLDSGVAPLCALAQRNPLMAYPTFALAFALFDDPAWDALPPGGPLRRWRLIEIARGAGESLIASPLRADERIVSAAKGLHEIDDRLEPLLLPSSMADMVAPIPVAANDLVDLIVHRVRRLDTSGPRVVELLGPDVRTKVAVARAAAADLGLVLRVMPSDALPADGPDLESAARLWHRDSSLLPIALFLDAHDADPTDPVARSIGRFLARSGGVVFVGTREPWPGRLQPVIAMEVPRPTATEQEEAWTAALPGVEEVVPAALAGQFSLDLGRIRDVADDVLGDAGLEPATLPERVWDACIARTRPRLDALATRIDPKATWDDIVLPPTALSLLHRITDQVRARTTVYERWGFASMTSRGLGISTLFAGASGTGKTMAAEVIANALRLNLYRIDLSAVVSKYIGETEKNLRRLFDAAEEGGALLFFDEADALFGKRSDVKDSHDRYANIEVNYLLQRMEAYAGIAVLATNMRNALDSAFMRRIRFIVTFDSPDLRDRRRIWQKAFPAAVPKATLDYDRLAMLPANGGMIHNIALNAAFAAARRNEPVTMSDVLEAGRTEFQKLELPVIDSAFSWTPPPAPPATAPVALSEVPA